MKEFGLIIKLLACVAIVIFFGDYIPEAVQQGFFTISNLIKELLTFFIPFVVFVFVASCLLAFQRSAPVVMAILLAFICLSNYLFTLMGYGIGELFMPDLSAISHHSITDESSKLCPYFDLHLPQLLSTDWALILGTIIGLGGTFLGSEKLKEVADTLKEKVQWALSHLFIPVLPLYIFGFLIKIQHDDSLADMFANYAPILVLIVGAQFWVTIGCFFAANGGHPMKTFQTIKTALSSSLVGFSTLSSAATMPVTLEAAKKNTGNNNLSQLVVPATANIHLIADSITLPLLLAAVYAVSGFPPMSFETFLYFSLFYMVAKFGVAAVPGGGLIVLLPLLESQFGFNTQMSGLIVTLYILLDPFLTSFNVMSNGAFAIFMNKVCGKMKAFQATPEIALEKSQQAT